MTKLYVNSAASLPAGWDIGNNTNDGTAKLDSGASGAKLDLDGIEGLTPSEGDTITFATDGTTVYAITGTAGSLKILSEVTAKVDASGNYVFPSGIWDTTSGEFTSTGVAHQDTCLLPTTMC